MQVQAPFKDPRLLTMMGSLLAAMEDDLGKQGHSEKKRKILLGSLLLEFGQSALIQAAAMPSIIPANDVPQVKQ